MSRPRLEAHHPSIYDHRQEAHHPSNVSRPRPEAHHPSTPSILVRLSQFQSLTPGLTLMQPLDEMTGMESYVYQLLCQESPTQNWIPLLKCMKVQAESVDNQQLVCEIDARVTPLQEEINKLAQDLKEVRNNLREGQKDILAALARPNR